MDRNRYAMLQVLDEVRRAVIKKPNHLASLEFLDRRQAAEYIGLSDFWLEKHSTDPAAPRFFRHGRKCWYKRTDLDEWIGKRKSLESAADNIWKRGEARRIAEPSQEELVSVYKETWGEEPATEDTRDAFSRLVDSLTPAQRRLLASTLAKDDKEAKTKK